MRSEPQQQPMLPFRLATWPSSSAGGDSSIPIRFCSVAIGQDWIQGDLTTMVAIWVRRCIRFHASSKETFDRIVETTRSILGTSLEHRTSRIRGSLLFRAARAGS